MDCRLHQHAAKFHRCSKKRMVLQKYSRAADCFGRAAARQHAAHVAAWIAYAPPETIPGEAEQKLLGKYLSLLGSGLLPLRLQLVLPEVQAALQRADWSSGSETQKAASRSLLERLQTFRCCRRPETSSVEAANAPPEQNARVAASNGRGVSTENNQPLFQLLDSDSADGGVSLRSGSKQAVHSLFRKINEWANMAQVERVQRLVESKALLCTSDRELSQAELLDLLCAATAALSPPRKMPARDEEALQKGLLQVEAEERQVSKLQCLARRLLLKALRAWQSMGFHCCDIEAVLSLIEKQISEFERKVGQIESAANGSVWLDIKQVVEELQQTPTEAPLPETRDLRSGAGQGGAPQGARRAALEKAMTALGGQASLKQLLRHMRKNPDEFQDVDLQVLKGRLQRSGAPEYFQLQGKDSAGDDIFIFAQPCPKGVRRLRRGFAARISVNDLSCKCVGPTRLSAEEAHRDFKTLQRWRAALSRTALLQRVRAWEGTRVISSRTRARRHRILACHDTSSPFRVLRMPLALMLRVLFRV